MRSKATLLGLLAVLAVLLMGQSAQWPAGSVTFSDADTLQAKFDSGEMLSMSAADCSAVTTGDLGMLCHETADDSIWRCTTTTCNAAGWTEVGSASGGGATSEAGLESDLLDVTDVYTDNDGVLVSPDGNPILNRTTNVGVAGNVRTFSLPIQVDTDGTPGGETLVSTSVEYGCTQSTGSGAWNKRDTLCERRYNHTGSAQEDATEHSVVDSWEYAFDAGVCDASCSNSGAGCASDSDCTSCGATACAGGTTTGDGVADTWIEHNVSITPAGGAASRFHTARINIDDDVGWWGWENRSTNDVMRLSDSSGFDGMLVGNNEDIGDSLLNTLQIHSDRTASSNAGIKNRMVYDGDIGAVAWTGIWQDLDYTATANNDDAGDLRAFWNDLKVDLSTFTGTTATVRAIYVPIEVTGGSASTTIGSVNAIEIPMDFDGLANGTIITTARGLFINTLPNRVNTSEVRSVYGIDIGDLGGQDNIPSRNGTIRIQEQDNSLYSSSLQGAHGNVMLEGFNWNNGHIHVGSGDGLNSADHLWRDQTNEVWRSASNGSPTSETDGAQLLTGSAETGDPCGTAPEGYVFYNDTSNYYCYCDGTNDVQMHSPATACF